MDEVIKIGDVVSIDYHKDFYGIAICASPLLSGFVGVMIDVNKNRFEPQIEFFRVECVHPTGENLSEVSNICMKLVELKFKGVNDERKKS